MKKILFILPFILLIATSACSTNATRSYELAEAGEYDLVFYHPLPKEELKALTINALHTKNYSIQKNGDSVLAKLNHGGIDAKLLYTFKDEEIKVNARGSTANGDPIVPLNWIYQVNNLVKKYSIKPLNR